MRQLLLFLLILLSVNAHSQDPTGAQFLTQENFLYGRFEVRMQSAPGDGIVSSFFLYNVDLNCNWPLENNEIDIEMTGNVEDVYFTTHYPGPWHYSDQLEVDFNPHAELHDYAIEWEPGVVRWYVDGELYNVQDQSFVASLIHPLRLMMNLWVANAPTWVGDWDPAGMPAQSRYDWVKVYEYTPGTGDYGNDNNFTLLWEDDFSTQNMDRWEITDFGGFDGNLSGFYAPNTEFDTEAGEVILHLQEAGPELDPIQVTFQVDVSNLEYDPWDNFYLNGSFNEWCGNCTQMSDSEGDETYDVTLALTPGKYEYLFTKNFWEENGGAPLGSSCDFEPCDEWENYGVVIPVGSDPIVIDVVCWGECGPCASMGLGEAELPDFDMTWNGEEIRIQNNGAPGSLEITNTLGQMVQRMDVRPGTVYIQPDVKGVFMTRFSRKGQEASVKRWVR